MLKITGFATILGLSLMAGCAAELSEQDKEISTVDTGYVSEFCMIDTGGSDTTPPPISVSIGGSNLSAPDLMVIAEDRSAEIPAWSSALLREFVMANVYIHAGADINSDDIDALIQAEDMLVNANIAPLMLMMHAYYPMANTASDRPTRDYYVLDRPTHEYEVLETVSAMNDEFRLIVPCVKVQPQQAIEVEAPMTAVEGNGLPHQDFNDALVGATTGEAGEASLDNLAPIDQDQKVGF